MEYARQREPEESLQQTIHDLWRTTEFYPSRERIEAEVEGILPCPRPEHCFTFGSAHADRTSKCHDLPVISAVSLCPNMGGNIQTGGTLPVRNQNHPF